MTDRNRWSSRSGSEPFHFARSQILAWYLLSLAIYREIERFMRCQRSLLSLISYHSAAPSRSLHIFSSGFPSNLSLDFSCLSIYLLPSKLGNRCEKWGNLVCDDGNWTSFEVELISKDPEFRILNSESSRKMNLSGGSFELFVLFGRCLWWWWYDMMNVCTSL